MHIEYPWDKFLKVNTILCDFWYILLHHSAKLLGQFINAMAVHLFPCIFINIGHYHGGKSVQQNRVYHCCLNLHFFDRSKCHFFTHRDYLNNLSLSSPLVVHFLQNFLQIIFIYLYTYLLPASSTRLLAPWLSISFIFVCLMLCLHIICI